LIRRKAERLPLYFQIERTRRSSHTISAKYSCRYDLDIKDDDIWNALNFLYKRGNVKIGGLDFGKLRDLRKEMRNGKKVS